MYREPISLALKNDFSFDKLSGFLDKNKLFNNSVMVLERNENSDLVPVAKPCTEEFFENIFDPAGPFWRVYSESGFAIVPVGMQYIIFISGRMYFLKNIDNVFINNIGAEQSFSLRDGLLIERRNVNLSNILLFLASPFDALKQVAKTIEFSFRANEAIKDFEDFRKKTLDYYNRYSVEANIADPLKIANEALELAVCSMAYSNIALLSYILKIKLKSCTAISICESGQLDSLITQGNMDDVRELFGFYSLAPYDISKPRFLEDTSDLERYGYAGTPKDYCLKWRENAKFLAARYLAIERSAFKKLGAFTGFGDLIFYLKVSELNNIKLDNQEQKDHLRQILEERRESFEKYKLIELPQKVIYYLGNIYVPDKSNFQGRPSNVAKGLSVSSSKKIIGPAVNINSFSDYQKCNDGSIIISKYLSPDLTILYGKAIGIISESGGALAHAALIARERDMPCLVQVKFYSAVKDGQYLEINGKTGEIRILDNPAIKGKKYYRHRHRINLLKRERIFSLNNITKDVIWPGDPDIDKMCLGKKAESLLKLSSLFPVPQAFYITIKPFKEIIKSDELQGLITGLKIKNTADILAIDEISCKIKEVIINCFFPAALESDLNKAVMALANKSMAVRSSSLLEDKAGISFAGQFDSYCGIKGVENLKIAIKKCWASFYNTRAIIYRMENNISDEDAGMSIIVQEIAQAEYSGVMLTMDFRNNGAILIELIAGMCENLVSGKALADSYLMKKGDFSIIMAQAKLEFDVTRLRGIADMGLRIEKFFGQPQEIEWCIDAKGKIWILQSRPVITFNTSKDDIDERSNKKNNI